MRKDLQGTGNQPVSANGSVGERAAIGSLGSLGVISGLLECVNRLAVEIDESVGSVLIIGGHDQARKAGKAQDDCS